MNYSKFNFQYANQDAKLNNRTFPAILNVTIPGVALLTSLLLTAALLGANGQGKPAQKQAPAKAPAKSEGKSAPATSSGADIAAGKKVYDANGCATCHAISGKGGSNGPDLTRTGADATHTAQWFSVQVATPKAHNPNSSMPGYATSIQGKDLVAISAYLVSLKGSSATTAPTKPSMPAVGAPDPAAVAQLEKLGAVVTPIAQGDNHLDVNLHTSGSAVTDASLAVLAKLPNIINLDLGGTSISDAGLVNLKGLKSLTRLHLEGTKVTDAGLVNVEGLRELTYLNLYNTGITDAGLARLTKLANLRSLYVWQTKVTDDGVAKLKQALPKLEVVQGWDKPAKK